jgi:ribosome-associated protein
MNESIVRKICQAIADKKGFNVVAINVQGISSMTDCFVIAEGSVDRHVSALANHIIDELRKHGEKPLHIEGLPTGDWVVLDYMDVVVHLFIPELREHYALEEIWKDGSIVNVPVSYEKIE